MKALVCRSLRSEDHSVVGRRWHFTLFGTSLDVHVLLIKTEKIRIVEAKLTGKAHLRVRENRQSGRVGDESSSRENALP